MLRLLLMSTPVGPLGSGIGGGVELTLKNLAQEAMRRGHSVRVVAPVGSQLPDVPLQEIPGNLQLSMQSQRRDISIYLAEDCVLAHMWEYARQVQDDTDLIVNFSYDWLPFYLTPFFTCPVAHWVTMASLTEAMDRIVQQISRQFPKAIAFYTHSQAETFGLGQGYPVLGSAIDLSLYQFRQEAGPALGWSGRISPEKGLEDAVAAAQMTGIPLKIFGKLQEPDYWDQIRRNYPDAPLDYRGFLPTQQLQQELGQCRALLVTSRWLEAFGNVAIEALACGVPVIAYRRGGPAEIVQDGRTGFLVEPDSVPALVAAIGRLDELDRRACRQQAEADYSLAALGHRLEGWFEEVIEFHHHRCQGNFSDSAR